MTHLRVCCFARKIVENTQKDLDSGQALPAVPIFQNKDGGYFVSQPFVFTEEVSQPLHPHPPPQPVLLPLSWR